MQCAYAAGISFFDTGGAERSEALLGEFLRTVPHSGVQIASSVKDFSPRSMRQSLEQSLQRLGVETIDVYLAHEIKRKEFRDDLIAELNKVRAEGKIGIWGVSLGPDIGWREEGFEALLKHRAQAVQTHFNIFEQNPGHELCELASSQHVGVLARADISDAAVATNKLEILRQYAQTHDMTLRQLGYKWLLQQPGLTSVTPTLLHEDDIAEAAESVNKPDLTMNELTQLARDYACDWNLGEEAHPRALKSSTDPSGRVRASYVAPPVLFA